MNGRQRWYCRRGKVSIESRSEEENIFSQRRSQKKEDAGGDSNNRQSSLLGSQTCLQSELGKLIMGEAEVKFFSGGLIGHKEGRSEMARNPQAIAH